jgi:putative glutamine amidotransferase
MRPDRDACGLAEDRVLEAVEARDRRFCVGVQWHPEAGDDRRLFGALVGAARNRAGDAEGGALWAGTGGP